MTEINRRVSTQRSSSHLSVSRQLTAVKSDDTFRHDEPIRRVVKVSSTLDYSTTNVRPCALTEMLLRYAEEDVETSVESSQTRSESSLNNVLNVLELHFNTYADDQRRIYFEGIFQILHDFQEQITEMVLIETMQFLELDLFAPCTFDKFILILCHLPPIRQDPHRLRNLFNELDHNNDSYITFEDIEIVLSHLTTHFDEEIIRAAIHTIDTDQDNGRLSYFDFVTSLIALQECHLTMKSKRALT